MRTAAGVRRAAVAVAAQEPAGVGGPGLPPAIVPGARATAAAIGRVPATRVVVGLTSRRADRVAMKRRTA